MNGGGKIMAGRGWLWVVARFSNAPLEAYFPLNWFHDFISSFHKVRKKISKYLLDTYIKPM